MGGITPVVSLLLLVILFCLSMGHHVFIISRIRETFDRGASTEEAIATGIKSTAAVVASAAMVMVAMGAGGARRWMTEEGVLVLCGG